MCGSMGWKALFIHATFGHIKLIFSGLLEVGYPALLSGFERGVVEALQTVGISLVSEPVEYLYTFL